MDSSLLSNQKIAKRKYYGVAGQESGTNGSDNGAYYPAVSSGVVNRQAKSKVSTKKNPRKKTYISAGSPPHGGANSRFIDEIKQEPVRLHKQNFSRTDKFNADDFQERRPSKQRVHFFTIPAIPAAALFLLVLGVLFSIEYDGRRLSFDWLGRNVVNPESDKNSQYNLAIYTGVQSEDNYEDQSEAIPLDLTEVFAWQAYKVKRGDTVSQIALDYSVSMDAIIASNGITNVRVLREGETLRIPNMDGIPYTVKSGDSLSGISSSMGVPLEAILDANDLESDIITVGTVLFIPGARMNREDLRLALGDLFVYPVKGARLSSPFGWRNDPITGVRSYHAAVDLSAPLGTQIKAAMEGKVAVVGYDRTYGNYIIITHPGSYQTLYAHLNSFSVKQNQQVVQGAQIGTVGSTGYSTGPHLHFAIYKNGRAVNPLDLLNQ